MCPFLHQHDISVRLYIFIPFCTCFSHFFSSSMSHHFCFLSVCNVNCFIWCVCVCAHKLVMAPTSHCLGLVCCWVEDVCVSVRARVWFRLSLLLLIFFTQGWGRFMDNLYLWVTDKINTVSIAKEHNSLSRLLFKGSKYSASLSSFLSILFCCSGLFLPPLAMVAPQVAGCMRSENTGEPAFYQNQTTVCRSRVPSHHISGSFLCCGFHSTVLSLASSFTQNALPVLWPFLTLWPEWVGSFLHLKFADIPTDGMKTSSVNAFFFLISGCCFICFVMRFFLSTFATHQSH